MINLKQEEPEIPFTEEDFRKRKPHPNYKEHLAAEKTIIKYGKTVSDHRLKLTILKSI